MTAPDSARRGEAQCREILEVGPEATHEDIRRSYLFLKELYAPGSTLLAAPLMDEFAPGTQARILAELETAYQELRELAEAARPAPPPTPQAPAQDPGRYLDGPALRGLREARGFNLEHMAAETSVRLAYLTALEEERFGELPAAAVIVRGYLTAYLAALGLEAPAAVAEYVRRGQGKG
jgi:hypothetical protein